VDENNLITINLLANDSDPDGVLVPGSVQVTSNPANGTVVVDLATGTVTYVPAPNFSGLDTFVYQVCDDDGACDTAVVTIVVNPVNDAPLAVSDVYTTPEDITLDVTSPGVLSNDTDPDVGDTLTALVVSGPGAGLLTLNSDGSFIYQPDLNFYGVDTFTYQACDAAGACVPAQVTITVTSVNDPPVAIDDAASTAEDTLEVIPVLANDSDVDGPDPLTIVAVSAPISGTVTSNGLNLTYYPNLNFHGTDTFTYTISDGLLMASAVVTVSVEPVNDAPVATDDDAYTLSGLPVPAPGVLSNDADPDGNPLIAILETGPVSGTLVLNTDGSFDYTPMDPLNFSGDSFTYRANDGVVDSNSATVTINP
jgi:VCBS repeat-containing protein